MGTDKVRILDRHGFHGDVYSMIDEAVAYILSKINVEYIIKLTNKLPNKLPNKLSNKSQSYLLPSVNRRYQGWS